MAMEASKEREYRICTTRLERSTLDSGYEIHARHFIPMGEDFEGWELLSVSPLEKESDHNYITMLVLIARTLDVDESGSLEDFPSIEEMAQPKKTHSLDQKAQDLYSYEEVLKKKARMIDICKIGGGLLLFFGLISLSTPLEKCLTWGKGLALASCDWDIALKMHLWFLFLGLPFFLYGWLAPNPILGVRGEIILCELARFLKRAEPDKRLTITSEFNSCNRLVLLVRDKREGPEQEQWSTELGVTEEGRLYKR